MGKIGKLLFDPKKNNNVLKRKLKKEFDFLAILFLQLELPG